MKRARVRTCNQPQVARFALPRPYRGALQKLLSPPQPTQAERGEKEKAAVIMRLTNYHAPTYNY